MIEDYLGGTSGICILSGLLFAVGVMLLMTEAVSPGLGAGGFAGLLCQLASFIPDVLQGSAPVTVLLLTLAGGVLLLLDSHVVGIGLMGWLGVGLLLGALWQAALNVLEFLYTLCASAVLAGAAMPVAIARLPKSRMMRRIALHDTVQGSIAAHRQLPVEGAQGVAFSDLRPRGVVVIEEERFDAIASTFIEKGAHIRVVRSEGNQLIVERGER